MENVSKGYNEIPVLLTIYPRKCALGRACRDPALVSTGSTGILGISFIKFWKSRFRWYSHDRNLEFDKNLKKNLYHLA